MPKLSEILPWLDAHAVAIGAVLAAMIAAWKAIPAKTRTALERRFPRLAGLARFVAAVGPDLLGAARIARYQIAAGQPRPTPFAPPRAVVPPPLPDLRDRASGGYAATTALLFAAVVAVALALAGCPAYVRPACGAPGAYSCVGDRPYVCSPSGALTPVGDVPCARSGGVCVVTEGVAHCAQAVDGGAK